nr:hypothetical protein [Tanacetum cinerariifolium]
RGLRSQNGSGRVKGVKEKDLNTNRMNTTSGIGLSMESDDTMNEDTLVVVAFAIKEVVTPYVVDLTIDKKRRSCLDDTTVLGSFPPLPTQGTTTASNAIGKSSYVNVIGKPSGKKVIFRTLFTPRRVAYLVVANYVRNTWGKYGLVRSMFSSMKVLDAMLENGSWFIRNNMLILKKYHPDVNLLKEVVSTIPVWVKLHGVPVTAFSEYGLSAIATKIEVGFKPTKEYTPVTKKHTANSSDNKKKGVEPYTQVSDLNPFEVLNSGVNDLKMGTTGGRQMKFEDLLTDGLVILVDEAGFGTHSLMEQWRDSYGNSDYDEDPYDDMYDGQDLYKEIQTIWDSLDIRVRGRKK